ASDLTSDVDWPPFDTSAMDGYAVRMADLEDLRRPVLERGGVLAAGDPPGAPLETGEAVRVMTGAPIPQGTEAIVPVEVANREEGRVLFREKPKPGAHIRRRGESIRAGTPLLATGRRLGAGDMALAALAGADPIRLVRRPRVTIGVTGNELVE